LHAALGLSRAEDDARVFTEDDVAAAKATRVFGEAGLPEDGRIEVARVIGRAMSEVAGAMRDLSSTALSRPGDTERDFALRLANSTRLALPQLGHVLHSVVSAHLREQVRQEVIAQADLRAGGRPPGRRVAVCFADLVDFTRLGESVDAGRLGNVARRLGELTDEVTSAPVRVVKMIGDAAMLVSPEPAPLLDAALELVERAEAEGDEFPELRAGVALGEAVTLGGDWYGRPVNLASRLTDIARPGSVLASREVHGELEDAYAWSFAGKRRIKGLDGDATVYRVRRAAADGAR
jgi:adenylate cyclase